MDIPCEICYGWEFRPNNVMQSLYAAMIVKNIDVPNGTCFDCCKDIVSLNKKEW